jgi:hypothetical protein
MMMKSGEHWHCTNEACGVEIHVESGGRIDGVNPRCVCGAALKKKYAAPVLRYLDFLSLDEPALARGTMEEG